MRVQLNCNVATIICMIIIKIISNLYLSHHRKIDFTYLSACRCALLKTFRPYFTTKYLTLIFETLIDSGRNWPPKLRSINQMKDRFLIIHLTLNLVTYVLLHTLNVHTFGNSDSKTKNVHLMIDSLINDETTVLGKYTTILYNF